VIKKLKDGGDRKTIFISSVQKELLNERRAIKVFVEGDALLRRYFNVFLFEDIPASDRKVGATGRSTHYILDRKRDIKRTNRT